MKWLLKEPSYGDMIRIKLGEIYHYGVYAGDSEIIAFGKATDHNTPIPEDEAEVCTVGIDEFINGGFLEVAELDKRELKRRNPPEEAVRIARSWLGERGYTLLYNNCENFAWHCLFGDGTKKVSPLHARFIKLPTLRVYIAKIPERKWLRRLYPKLRHEEVKKIKNPELKRHKYFAWRLLEQALQSTYGYKINEMEFFKAPNGKWTTPSCRFSISHSGNIVVVALSRTAVGVDIQRFSVPSSPKFAERIMNEKEHEAFATVAECERNEELIKIWTKKESIFKSLDLPHYNAAEIDTTKHQTHTERIEFDGEVYFLSVANERLDKLTVEKVEIKKNGTKKR